MNTDIVIRTHSGDLQSRVMVYPGSARYAARARFGRQIYRKGAFLPRGSLRRLRPDELSALEHQGQRVERSRMIGIVRLRASLVDDLWAAKTDEGKIPDAALREYPFAQLASALAPAWTVRGPLLALGYAGYPAGFHTVTFDAAHSEFIGLHIDDLDGIPLERREESTTRLCINLGQHPRYLLFMNVSVLTMARMLAGDVTGGSYIRMRSTPLIHAFMNAFPGYPVVRLEVRPGEAYIAPTENMIHDGSTLGMPDTDYQVTLRGFIDPVY